MVFLLRNVSEDFKRQNIFWPKKKKTIFRGGGGGWSLILGDSKRSFHTSIQVINWLPNSLFHGKCSSENPENRLTNHKLLNSCLFFWPLKLRHCFQEIVRTLSQRRLKFRNNDLLNKHFIIYFLAVFRTITSSTFGGVPVWREPMLKKHSKRNQRHGNCRCSGAFSRNTLKIRARWYQKAESGLRTR